MWDVGCGMWDVGCHARRPCRAHPTSRIPHGPSLAFTLVELMIVLMVIAICAALVVPQLGGDAGTKLTAAARLLAADLGAAQIDSIAHGESPRVVVFAPDDDGYHLAAAADPGTPVNNPLGNVPYAVTFGEGRARGLAGVTFDAMNVGDDAQLGFGVYGQLDQADDAILTLACAGRTLTLTVQASTGEVTVGN